MTIVTSHYLNCKRQFETLKYCQSVFSDFIEIVPYPHQYSKGAVNTAGFLTSQDEARCNWISLSDTIYTSQPRSLFIFEIVQHFLLCFSLYKNILNVSHFFEEKFKYSCHTLFPIRSLFTCTCCNFKVIKERKKVSVVTSCYSILIQYPYVDWYFLIFKTLWLDWIQDLIDCIQKNWHLAIARHFQRLFIAVHAIISNLPRRKYKVRCVSLLAPSYSLSSLTCYNEVNEDFLNHAICISIGFFFSDFK